MTNEDMQPPFDPANITEPPNVSEEERLEINHYPEERVFDASAEVENSINTLVKEATEKAEQPQSTEATPFGYVTNADNAMSESDTFRFWAPAERGGLGIGGMVRHSIPGTDPTQPIDTYAVITATEARTLGLEDVAIHAYEHDGVPPLEGIKGAPSRRRPIVNYEAKVLASTEIAERPVLPGPVYPLAASELETMQNTLTDNRGAWPDEPYMLLGFYEDANGDFGVLQEERARVLGPKQGHVVLSGIPGAGKTSLYQTTLISLYAQLRFLEGEKDDTSVEK